MTVITPDYRLETVTAQPPAALTALLAITTAAAVAQSLLGGMLLLHGGANSFWRMVGLALSGAAVAGLPVLGLLAYQALAAAGSTSAVAMARFLRFAFYAAILSYFLTAGVESAHFPIKALALVVSALRLAVTAGLPIVTLIFLRRSKAVHALYGESFSLQVSDAQMLSVSRDGAASILLMVGALVAVLFIAALPSIRAFGWSFLYTSEWRANPLPGGPDLDANGDAKTDPDTGETLMKPESPPVFGALPLIYGTVASSVIALAVAVPLSFGAALFLVRVAPKFMIAPVSFLIEFLAAVPSIAYGLWGLFVLAPFLQTHFEPLFQKLYRVLPALGWDLWLFVLLIVGVAAAAAFAFVRLVAAGVSKWTVYGVLSGLAILAIVGVSLVVEQGYFGHALMPGFRDFLGGRLGFQPNLRWLFFYTVPAPAGGVEYRPVALTGNDMLCGGLILAVMIVPIITAIGRDVLRSVPGAQIEGTTALGATWWGSCKEMLKYSRSALFGAVMLGLARAAGETMAVTMVIGNNPQIKASPFMAAQTMSSLLANQFAEASSSIHRAALFEVALVLLIMSLAFNVIARYLVVGKSARTSAAH